MCQTNDNQEDNDGKQEKAPDKSPEKSAPKPQSCEHQSARRTAEFLARKLGEVQDQLCDLIPDMRSFEHYSEIEDTGWCLRILQNVRKKYRKFAADGVWKGDDEE